jgi:outer membrane protein, multidrug efflux system
MVDRRLIPLAAALALAGCSLAPKFEQPKVETPNAFKREAMTLTDAERGTWKVGEPAEAQPRGEWWKAFGDPTLDQLETAAMADNPGLQAAAARVLQARAVLGITEADRIPQVSVGVGPFNTRPSPASAGLPADANTSSRTLWRANAVASYEVDLFGRVKNSIGAAKNDLEGTEATFRSIILTLQADVARTYFELRETDGDVALLKEAVRLREAALKLNEARYQAGAVGELDVARAKAELAVTRTDLAAADGRRARIENALAILLGKPPASFSLAATAVPTAVPSIPAGLPSSLLERRPDIVAAQRALVSANARIGVAKAAFFPQIKLTGQAGFESDDMSDLFRWSSRTWFFGPFLGALISVPILDGGRNRNELARVKAVYEESVGNYRQKVLIAFGDVEDSLAGLRSLAGQASANQDAVVAAKRAAQLAQIRYDAGATSYLEVIDAQRTALDVERDENRIRGARVTGTVALIRALGGGWGNLPADEPQKVSAR